ncbi:hypothetical protein [Neorhizobium alkalisoli]|uniref:hypothetical protein n=1 Tax=Neorhizobium alkalisoli TaxID=528178 RepID=UPI000CF84DAC|nr:hypothetical protein [Neorhizobium alkalisoli]
MNKLCLLILTLSIGFPSLTFGVATAEEGDYYDSIPGQGYSALAPDSMTTSGIMNSGEVRDLPYPLRNRGGRDNNWPAFNDGMPLSD